MIKTLRVCLLTIALLVTGYYAFVHFRVLGITHPITQDEPGTIQLSVAANPYSLSGVESCANVYGPVYAWWARPFTAVIADPYVAHRWATSVALLAGMGILAWSLLRERIGKIELVASLAIFYALNASSHSLAATPDLLGVALYLSALALSRQGSWPALVSGLILALLAALTKPYFALGWVAIASHQLLFLPPRKAVTYLAISTAVAGVTAALLHVLAPYYFLSTFLVHQVATRRSAVILLGQAREFALLACGLLLLALLSLRLQRRTVRWSFKSPVINPPMDLWTWSSLLAVAALLGFLGWHPGNYLIYFYHLLLGPLIAVGMRGFSRYPRFGHLALIGNLLILGYLLPAPPGPDQWSKLEAEVVAVQGPILADPLLEPLTRHRPSMELFSRGQTAAILRAFDQFEAPLPPPYLTVKQDLLAQAEKINARIRDHAFAAIFISYQNLGTRPEWNYDQLHVLPTLSAHYQLAGETVVYPYATPYWDRLRHGQFAFHVTKWVPKFTAQK